MAKKIVFNPLYQEGRFIARQDNVEDKTVTKIHDHNDKQSSFEYDDTQNCYKDGDWRKFLHILILRLHLNCMLLLLTSTCICTK